MFDENEDGLDEDTKEAIRELGPAKRAGLRRWFNDDPHYRDLVAFIDFLDGKPSDV